MKTFDEIVEKCKSIPKLTVCVAVAEDEAIIDAVNKAVEMGLCEAVLVGNREKIMALTQESNYQIVDATSDEDAVAKAVELVRNGDADVLMKGLVNTSIFMKGVLNKEKGLRTGRLISHMACYEIPLA